MPNIRGMSQWIVKLALNRPYTFIVMALLILVLSPLVILRTPTDIFPNIDIPVISVAWTFMAQVRQIPGLVDLRVQQPLDRDLGAVSRDVEKIVSANQKLLPRGTFISVRGQVQTMRSSYLGLWSITPASASLGVFSIELATAVKAIGSNVTGVQGDASDLSERDQSRRAFICADLDHGLEGRGVSRFGRQQLHHRNGTVCGWWHSTGVGRHDP
jgi:hypothetical protein